MKYTQELERKAIQWSLVIFWFFFWGLNTVDKFIPKPTFLWVGKDRLSQFVDYFAAIGIHHSSVPFAVLAGVTIAELVATVLFFLSAWFLFKKKYLEAKGLFLKGTAVSIGIFIFFSLGDQIFGDRVELLEHSIYLAILLVSWSSYAAFSDKQKQS